MCNVSSRRKWYIIIHSHFISEMSQQSQIQSYNQTTPDHLTSKVTILLLFLVMKWVQCTWLFPMINKKWTSFCLFCSTFCTWHYLNRPSNYQLMNSVTSVVEIQGGVDFCSKASSRKIFLWLDFPWLSKCLKNYSCWKLTITKKH